MNPDRHLPAVIEQHPIASWYAPPPSASEPEPEEAAIPLSHYLWILKRHRWRILSFVGACVLAAVVVSSRLTPVYESTATVDVDRQTPQGVIEMKRFFSTGLATADGEEQSSRAVQAQIRQMIEAENSHKPLSDQAIADELQKRGLEIARRTVAKYREEMDIPTSGRRRHFGK